MKFEIKQLEEAKAIHWGDLDYGKKADARKIMGGRGTGHFGTGFYFVGAEGPYGIGGSKYRDYNPKRPIYEIDLDSYNLFKPKDNDTAYRIHDNLKTINNKYNDNIDKYLFKPFDKEKMIDDIYYIYEQADELFKDYISKNLGLSEDEEDEKFKEFYDQKAKEFIERNDLERYIPYSDIDRFLSSNKLVEIEDELKDAIDDIENRKDYIEFAIDDLSKELNIDRNRLLDIIRKSYNNKEDEETISTHIFKDLGYEGVDVTHLNKDAQGLSGLDNFTYGTVIYDLKPGTFKRIQEPRETSEEKRTNTMKFRLIEDKENKPHYFVKMENTTTGEVIEKYFYYLDYKEKVFNKILKWVKYIKSNYPEDDDWIVDIEDSERVNESISSKNAFKIKSSLEEKIINEIYPNKGESEKDFISRFMSVTKDEYPDVKQRYAVAKSYWKRRDKR